MKKEWVALFIKQKQVSKNTQLAYQYDLQQFMEVCEGQVTDAKLDIYQAFLQSLKPRAQKRKLSVVNQFLYFLYEMGKLERFYKLTVTVRSSLSETTPEKENRERLFDASEQVQGQLVALLIAYLGLTPSEITQLETKDINLEFQVMTVEREGQRRVVKLPKELLPYLQAQLTGTYLFDKKGQSYSRQWLFNRLSEYVTSLGKKEWTAQKLREQYIVHQLAQRSSLEDIRQQLGLKSVLSLEKYKENGY